MLDMDEIIREVAFVDGSLRDIYIFDVNLEDWNRFVKLLKEFYVLECEEEVIPESIHEIMSIYNERGFLLSVILGKGIVANCHFYVSEESHSPIELGFGKTRNVRYKKL